MSYASDFFGGFNAIDGALQKRKDRKFDKEQADAADSRALADRLQRERMAEADRIFRGQQSDTDRGLTRELREGDREFSRSERMGTQEFTAGQNSQGRTFQGGLQDKAQAFQAQQDEAARQERMARDAEDMKLKQAGAALAREQFDYTKDPNNPQNINAIAHSKYLTQGIAPDLPNATDALRNGTKGMPPTQTSGPNQAAIDYLKQNPQMRAAFDAKFGAGASAKILGQ